MNIENLTEKRKLKLAELMPDYFWIKKWYSKINECETYRILKKSGHEIVRDEWDFVINCFLRKLNDIQIYEKYLNKLGEITYNKSQTKHAINYHLATWEEKMEALEKVEIIKYD